VEKVHQIADYEDPPKPAKAAEPQRWSPLNVTK
jgi:hypothetical protein